MCCGADRAPPSSQPTGQRRYVLLVHRQGTQAAYAVQGQRRAPMMGLAVAAGIALNLVHKLCGAGEGGAHR